MNYKPRKGFTIVELIVSVSIFVFITALLVAKYGSFNQGTLLTNLAYDIALTIRTAQTYGLSVKRSGTDTSSASFLNPYGVEFNAGTTAGVNDNQKFILFTDLALTRNNRYDSGEEVSTYNIKKGAYVSNICVGSGIPPNPCSTEDVKKLDIIFTRPDPSAIIFCIKLSSGPECPLPPFTYAKITVKSSDGSKRNIVVRKIGQVSVEEDVVSPYTVEEGVPVDDGATLD